MSLFKHFCDISKVNFTNMSEGETFCSVSMNQSDLVLNSLPDPVSPHQNFSFLSVRFCCNKTLQELGSN